MMDALQPLLETITAWGQAIYELAPNIAVAVLLCGIGIPIARVLASVASSGLSRTALNESIVGLITTVVRIAAYAMFLVAALSVLGLDKAVTSMLAGAGVIGLALGFAFQEVAQNVISGVGLSMRNLFEIGDVIETHGHAGIVEEIGVRTTTIRAFDGQVVSVPNRKVFQELLINRTTNDARRVDVSVGVGYGEDLEEVARITRDCLADIQGRIQDREIEVLATAFGGSSVDLDCRVWFEQKDTFAVVKKKDAMIRAIHRAYAKHGVDIPYPTRTLMVDGTSIEDVPKKREGDSREALVISLN